MPNDLDKILAPDTQCLSNETLRAYLEGRAQNKQQVERHLVDCELCNGALEGFAAIPAFGSAEDLNAEIRQRAAKGHASNWMTMSAGVLLGAALLAVTFLLLQDKQNDNTVDGILEDPVEQPVGISEEGPVSGSTPAEGPTPEVAIDPSMHERTVAEQPPVTINEKEVDLIVRGSGPDKILIRRTDPELLRISDDTKIKTPKVWSNVHIAFVHDLVIVDYSKILTSGVSTIEERYGSLHPRYETWEDRTVIKLEQRTYNVPYIEYMKGTMSGFAKGDPAKTLAALKELLDQRDTDVNGLFYSGLCLYHLERPAEAIEMFDAAIASSINTFYEEAKWYKALSLLKMKANAEAQLLLEEIVEEAGFYAERAKEELTQ